MYSKTQILIGDKITGMENQVKKGRDVYLRKEKSNETLEKHA